MAKEELLEFPGVV